MLIELVIVKQTEILIQATKLNDSNMIRTHNHLLCKKTLNRFTSLAHSAQEYFEKSAFKKKTKRNFESNGCISKARANSESKLTFSENSFNFLQNKVVFCTLRGLCPLQPPVPLPTARRAQRVNEEIGNQICRNMKKRQKRQLKYPN